MVMIIIICITVISASIDGILSSNPYCETESSNPCADGKYMVLSDRNRHINYYNSSTSILADTIILRRWYRAIGMAGEDLSIVPLTPPACQSLKPIWLNGSIPQVSEGIVQRIACVSNFEGDTCNQSLPICVKNCGNFNIYFLERPPSSYARYCFGPKPGNNIESSTSTTTTSSTKQSQTPAGRSTSTSEGQNTKISTTSISSSTTESQQRSTVLTPKGTGSSILNDGNDKDDNHETDGNNGVIYISIGVVVGILVIGAPGLICCICYLKVHRKDSSPKYLEQHVHGINTVYGKEKTGIMGGNFVGISNGGSKTYSTNSNPAIYNHYEEIPEKTDAPTYEELQRKGLEGDYQSLSLDKK